MLPGSCTCVYSSTVKPVGQEVDQAWAQRYTGPGNGTDDPRGIITDTNGNVYVTGMSWSGTNTQYDIVTLKYAADGTLLWLATYDDASHGYDAPVAIAQDDCGDVYVTGISDGFFDNVGESSGDMVTLKYDAQGNQVWAAVYSGIYGGAYLGTAVPSAITVDSACNVYVTGAGPIDFANEFILTVKYDPNGNESWEACYTNSVCTASEWGQVVQVDPTGNVYVAGSVCRDGGGQDYWTMKYDSMGNLLWSRDYRGDPNLGNWNNIVQGMQVDQFGNVYITGYSDTYGFDYATVKYDTQGNQLWVQRYNSGVGNTTECDNYATGLALDGSNNVYVTGHYQADFYTPNDTWVGRSDYVTVKYDTNGNQLWVQDYGGTASSNAQPQGIVSDPAGNVYVTGYAQDLDTGSDCVTIKYDPQGHQLWAAVYDGPAHLDDYGRAVTVDSLGNVCVAAGSDDADGVLHFATIKYTQGAPLAPLAGVNVNGSLINQASGGALAGVAGLKTQIKCGVHAGNSSYLGKKIFLQFSSLQPDGLVHAYQAVGKYLGSLTPLRNDPDERTGEVTATVTLTDVTKGMLLNEIDSAAQLDLVLTQRRHAPSSVAITLREDGGSLWFSSNWDGIQTIEQPLAKGAANIQFR